jgi:hypothetical protein
MIRDRRERIMAQEERHHERVDRLKKAYDELAGAEKRLL